MGYTDEQRARLLAAGVDPDAIQAPPNAAFPEAFAPAAVPAAPATPEVAAAAPLPFPVVNPGLGPASDWSQQQRERLLAAGVDPMAIAPPRVLPPEQPTAQPEQQAMQSAAAPMARMQPQQQSAPARRPGGGRRGPSGMQVALEGRQKALDQLGQSESELGQQYASSGLTQQAQIEASLGDAEALRNKAMMDYAAIEADRQTKSAALDAAKSKVAVDMEQLQKDYDNVGDKRTVGRKIGDVLAIALGAIGAGIARAGGANAQNDVLQLVQRRIQNDISLQFQKLDKRGVAIDARDRQIQLARATLGDDTAAKQFLVAQELRRASDIVGEGQLAQYAESVGMNGTELQAKLGMLADQRDLEVANSRVAFEQQRILEAQKAAARAKKKEQSQALPPGFRIVDQDRFEGVGQDRREKAIEAANVGRRLVDVDNRMRQLISENPTLSRFGSLSAIAGALGQDGANVAAELESLHAQKVALMNRTLELGALDEGGRSIVEGSIGDDPTAIFKSGYQAKSKAAIDTILGGVRRDMERVGLKAPAPELLEAKVREGAR